MLTIRWDTLFVATIVIVLAGFLLVQAALRVELFRLFEARQLSRANTTDEPNLYEFFALMILYVEGCDRLGRAADVERAPEETSR